MKLIFLSFFLLLFTNITCQITVVDSNNLPIAFVQLFSSRQTFLAQSNESGVVNWTKLQHLGMKDTIYFNHISYNSKWVMKKNIQVNDTIVLTEKNYYLPEVTVPEKKVSKKYQSINACFRSYQTNNDSLIYYTDGLVEYLTKTKKNKYQRRLKEFRIFQDSSYISNIKVRNVSVVFRVARIPPPLADYLPKYYFKRNGLILSKKTSEKIDVITKDSLNLGNIKKDSNLVTYTIKDIFSCKSRKSPKHEVIQIKSEVTLVFKVGEINNDLLFESFDNLVYSKIHRIYNFKHVSDKNFTVINNVEEIFVEEVNDLNEIEADNYSSSFGFPKKSNYSTPFWGKCKCELYHIPPFEPSVLIP